MKKPQYFSPVVTAFNEDRTIDKAANVLIWDRLIEGGVTGIVVMGSTGEFFAMSKQQKLELIELAAEHLKGRTQLFIGTGNMRLEDTVELSNIAFEKGADGVMIISPYYFNLSDESIEDYFSAAAKDINGNIFMYNFPERTSYDLKPSIALSLLRQHSNIIGYKDTVGSMSHTRMLVSTIRTGGSEDFIILSGKDENFAHTLMSGGNGCIGGFSNLYPELCGAWVEAMQNLDMDKASAIQAVMDRINDIAVIGTPGIPIMKKAMILRGVQMKDYCQFPFRSADEKQTQLIQKILDEVNPKVKALVG
ncbi:MAG: dihydrodipicolinate synthase family protein [Oscillospiraceae bacterium]|nr:dihydrodipicolinate synthase family protein [Oscillospiraceae bacterium]